MENVTIAHMGLFNSDKDMLEYFRNHTCYEFDCSQTCVRTLPGNIKVTHRLDLSESEIERLPPHLTVSILDLRECDFLRKLPRHLTVRSLNISRCRQITETPPDMVVEHMEFIAENCVNLTKLNGTFRNLARMNLRGCTNLRSIPEGVEVTRWVEIGGTQIRKFPKSLSDVILRWNGMELEHRIVFNPETITAKEVLQTDNAEMRRVKLQFMGYQRFFEEAKPDILDQDTDAGGPRQLLCLKFNRNQPNDYRYQEDEPLVCVSYKCPSTGRQYVVRVPPNITKCKQAVAWIAGFDNPNDYHPMYET